MPLYIQLSLADWVAQDVALLVFSLPYTSHIWCLRIERIVCGKEWGLLASSKDTDYQFAFDLLFLWVIFKRIFSMVSKRMATSRQRPAKNSGCDSKNRVHVRFDFHAGPLNIETNQNKLHIISLWWLCITFVWPRGSKKLPTTASSTNRKAICWYFTLIKLYLALLFIISIGRYT